MICTSYDEFLQDQDTSVWVVELVKKFKLPKEISTVFCDDGRYGENDKAWNRLRKYLEENREYRIDKIRVKFRSHIELAAQRGPNTVGFYFGRAASCWVGCPTNNYMVLGTVEKNNEELVVKTTKWRVPEVIKEESEERNPSDYLENIIWD